MPEQTLQRGGNTAIVVKPVEILLVEDDAAHVELIARAFESRAEEVRLTHAQNLRDAREQLDRGSIDLVIADLLLPDGRGVELLPQHGEEVQCPVVIMTSHGDEQAAVEAMKAGALDYVVKSEATLADLPHAAESALRQWRHVLERRRAETALRENETWLRTILSSILDPMLTIDGDGIVLSASDSVERVFGWKPDEIIGQGIGVLMPEPYRGEHDGYLENYRLTGESNIVGQTRELVAQRKDGSTFPCEVTVWRVDMPGSSEPSFTGIVRDITERNRAETALREQRELLSNILSNIPHSVFWKDRNSVYLGCNQNLAKDLGVKKPEDAIGKTDYEMGVKHEEADFFRKCDQEVMETGRAMLNIEEPQLRPDGTQATLLTSKVPLRDEAGEIFGILGIYANITERKKAEEYLRQSETRFRNLIEGSLQGILVHRNQKAMFVNEAWEKFLGYTPEEILAMDSILIMAAPHERARMAAYCNTRMAGQPAPTQYEYQGLRKDGSLAWLEIRTMVVDWDGEPAVQLTLMDVTERRLAEDELRERERQYRLVTDNIPARISYFDTDQRFCFANNPVEQLFVHEQNQIIGKRVRDLLGEPGYAVLREYIERALSGERVSTEALVPYPDGKSSWIAISYVPDVDHRGNVKGVYGLAIDITERKQAEEKAQKHLAELAHVTRLGTMGEMVSGLAHELNQPLAAIVNFADACKQTLAKGGPLPVEKLRSWVSKIGDQAYRSGQIIHRLRNLVKKTAPRRSTVDVNHLVNEAVDLLRTDTWMDEVQLNLNLTPSIPMVVADGIQIQQVILNLVKNASEAFAEEQDGSREVTLETSAIDGGVEVAVADTGAGFTVDNPEILFDAFFTTKPDGMGMGLAISRSIVEAHGGRLWATSNGNRGATFRFTLPTTGQRGHTHGE